MDTLAIRRLQSSFNDSLRQTDLDLENREQMFYIEISLGKCKATILTGADVKQRAQTCHLKDEGQVFATNSFQLTLLKPTLYIIIYDELTLKI